MSRAGGDGIVTLSANDLSLAIRSREVSCEEVMATYLEHIDRYNPRFNAIVSRRDPELLVEEARERDRELDLGIHRGWLHGFPHAVKDLADVEGLATTKGSPIHRDTVAEADSIFVERLRAAGAIFIGKTNVPELGLGSQSYNPVFGATRNAWDGASTAGGSSGGAAAALALRLLPVADGSDMMGSLRNPAGFNNVVGFRPSLGRVPTGPRFLQQLAVSGPMARTVADAAMLLSVMAGFDRRDPLSLHEDPACFAQSLERDFRGSRIGWLGDCDGYLAMEDGVLELCTRALATFEAVGCTVEAAAIDFSMAELWQTWLTLRHWWVGGASADLYRDPATRGLLKPELVWEIEGSFGLTGEDVHRADAARRLFYEAITRTFDRHDFLVLPTAQVFPFDVQTHWPQEIAGRQMDTYHRWMEVVLPGTLSGGPAIGVPAGFGDRGLPIGLQILGPAQADLAVLQIAHAYEQAAPWHASTPPALRAPARS